MTGPHGSGGGGSVFLACICFFSVCNIAQAVQLLMNTKAVNLNEKESTSATLTTATCVASAADDSCSISIVGTYPTNPCGNCFALYPSDNNNKGEYTLKYLPGQGFINPFIANRYSITLEATDDTSDNTSIVDVHIKPNTPPFFNFVKYPTKHLSERLNIDGSVEVTAKDLDDDQITYSMTLVPKMDGLTIDSVSGTITATKDLQALCRSFVTALVYAKDNYHTDVSDPLAVTITFNPSNDRPIINNLDTVVYVREDEGVGETFMELATFDEGKNELKYTMTTVPSSAYDLFEIEEASHELKVKSALDYEKYPEGVTLSIKVSDGFCDSETHLLLVELVDINEPPVLLPQDQSIDSCEGEVQIHPKWNLTDPDIGDVPRFTHIYPNDLGYFKVDEKSGVVSTTIDYDVDEPNEMPASVTMRVEAADQRGLTATATLTVRFRDCNDNAPYFTIPSKHFEVKDCDPADTVIDGNVAFAKDKDSDYNQNNEISYSGFGGAVQVQDSGTLVLVRQMVAGETVTFPVYATDKGKEPKSLQSVQPFMASVYVLPCFNATSSSGGGNKGDGDDEDDETTTDAFGGSGNDVGDFWDPDGPNLGWMIPALLLMLPLLAMPFLLLWRYWGRVKNCFANRRPCCPKMDEPAPRPATPVRKLTPPPEQEGPGFIFGWWKETYPNNDYERAPNRLALPEPSKGPEPVETNTYNYVTEPNPIIAAPPTPPPPKSSSCHIM